jgi:hypothetical protein
MIQVNVSGSKYVNISANNNNNNNNTICWVKTAEYQANTGSRMKFTLWLVLSHTLPVCNVFLVTEQEVCSYVFSQAESSFAVQF